METKMSFSIASTFIWIGFVGAISFMEAWLKFRAPGVDISTGLSIGRLVFGALNKVEWVLAIIIVINFIYTQSHLICIENLLLLIPIVLLTLQTLWLLPALDARAELYIQGTKPPASGLHYYYVGAEILKVVSLIILGIKLLKP